MFNINASLTADRLLILLNNSYKTDTFVVNNPIKTTVNNVLV